MEICKGLEVKFVNQNASQGIKKLHSQGLSEIQKMVLSASLQSELTLFPSRPESPRSPFTPGDPLGPLSPSGPSDPSKPAAP